MFKVNNKATRTTLWTKFRIGFTNYSKVFILAFEQVTAGRFNDELKQTLMSFIS